MMWPEYLISTTRRLSMKQDLDGRLHNLTADQKCAYEYVEWKHTDQKLMFVTGLGGVW